MFKGHHRHSIVPGVFTDCAPALQSYAYFYIEGSLIADVNKEVFFMFCMQTAETILLQL